MEEYYIAVLLNKNGTRSPLLFDSRREMDEILETAYLAGVEKVEMKLRCTSEPTVQMLEG